MAHGAVGRLPADEEHSLLWNLISQVAKPLKTVLTGRTGVGGSLQSWTRTRGLRTPSNVPTFDYSRRGGPGRRDRRHTGAGSDDPVPAEVNTCPGSGTVGN